jgi:diguanylate cyclase (GGDEF)-like protein/PAS domain S-box-containing protein
MLNRIKTLTTRLWFRAIIFAAIYFASALLSNEISFQGASFTSIWFPSGVFVAFLLLSEVQVWPVYILVALPTSLAYSLLTSQTPVDALLLYISGTLEAAAGAWLIRRFDEKSGQFSSPLNVLYLIVLSALLSSALSATISTTVLATMARGISYWSVWQIGWISHGLGILVAGPLILSWSGIRLQMIRKFDPERIIEMAILTTGLIVCSLYIFVGNFNNHGNYVVIPFLLWVSLRFGPRGTTFCGLLITIMAAWGTAHQLGGFASSDITIAPNVSTLGSFLAITLITCYILATVWDQGKRTEKALRDSEERYRLLVENQGEGVAIVNADEVFTFANPTANQIFGANDLVGHSLKEFTDPQQYEMIRHQTRLRQAGMKTTYEVEIVNSGGKRCNLLVSATPENNNSRFSGTFAVFHDITERKQAEMALRDSRARFKTLFEHSPVPIWEEDFSRVKLLIDGLRRDGISDFREYFNEHPEQVEACEHLIRVLDVNQAAMQPFNLDNKAHFLANLDKLIHRGPRDLFLEELIAISEGKSEFEMEGPNDIIDGVIRYHNVRWTVAPGYEANYRRMIVTILDVTERKQAEERMRYLSTHDVLTGLYNRNFFETEMERLQNSRMEPVNVMMIDVNGMKSTNDTYGHAAGDELLRRSAQVLRMSFRKEDIIARIGGDEFVVLFHGSISIQDAVNRVKDCLAEHNHWYEGPALSLAIGAASGTKGSLLLELFKKADQQMYKEKVRTRKARPEARSEAKTEPNPGNPPQNN